MNVDLFDFVLPAGLIADRPAHPRDAARLLGVGESGLLDAHVSDLPGLLRPGDLLVVNDTRVIPARLRGMRRAAKVEILLHQRVAPDIWRVFARPARKLAAGDEVVFAGDFLAHVVERGEGGEVTLRFNRSGPSLMAALEAFGETPLPPYIKRPAGADARDRADYQTMFAAERGAVAAPTAGLHFTPDLIAALGKRGIGRVAVTLHVGAGTFLPVKVEDTADHRMHFEEGTITSEVAARIDATRRDGGRVVAVGTTSTRLLESAVDETGAVRPFHGATDLFIVPGFRFRAVDVLMTNFHLPRSTLFMLVSAFSGLEKMQAAYAHAIAGGYRFYSYGDACLLDPAAEYP